jgi:tetratricopeptide (TPR) repeat protein
MRNFALKLFGDTYQIIVNTATPAEFALPPAVEPDLTRFALDDAIEDGEPDLFRALRWDYGLVETLFGRDDDLRAISDWAKSGTNTATVRLVTGDGGVGKTRLAAAAAAALRDEGWTAGFLPRSEQMLFDVGDRGLFLILDYPEEQMERTRALFAKLAEMRSAPYPIRLLLLSRRPFAAWEREADVLEGRFGRQAIAAPGSLSVEDSLALIGEAVERFARTAGLQEPSLSDAAEWLARSPVHTLPLFATAAALHAVLAPQEAFGLGHGALIRDLARRERRRVHRVSQALGLGEEGLERLLALGVLADGLSETDIKALSEAGAVDAATSDVVGALSGSPWWSNGCLIQLQPDKPAAAFVDIALFPSAFPNGRDELPDWLFIALQARAETFGDRISRILHDLTAVDRAEPGEHPLDRCLIAMLRHDRSRTAVFSPIAYQEVTHWAASFAAEVAMTLADRTEEPEARAVLRHNGAAYLSAVGRREEALVAAQEAVALRRTLATDRPDAFTPDLAGSLNNLANMLANLGRWEEALAAAQEAADLYRTLATDRPDAFTPDLAKSLNNLANVLSDLGRREEALATAQEAADLYRTLATDRPDAFTHNLAGSLTNLANTLSDLGRREEALAAAQEAADLDRTLATDRPDAFTPDLAMSLNNLAAVLSDLGRSEEALVAAQEAVTLLRPYFLRQPAAFASWMKMIVEVYLRECEANQMNPDQALLEPIAKAFQGLNQ